MVSPGSIPSPENFTWSILPRLVAAYEAAAHSRLTAGERRALVPYTAAVPLYHAAIAAFSADPAGQLREKRPFLQLSAWLLAHPDALFG